MNNSRRGLFITGTDTDVGKTWVSAGLMLALKAQGKSVLGMKPIAAGAVQEAGRLRNKDALRLQAQGTHPVDYAQLNPYVFAPAMAPHLAAEQSGERITIERIERHYVELAKQADYIVVEGAGGWLVPINERQTMADMAAHLQLEVIIVVGLRLGCINHTLLTAEAVRTRGLRLAGWVANTLDVRMSRLPQNILAIQQRLDAPLLGVIPHLPAFSPEQIAEQLDVQPILRAPSLCF
jgi:dethiobiotin synthetase